MAITYVFAGVPVSDYENALPWYERLFGRPPDRLPADDEAVWHLAETGLVYLVRDQERAGRALVTLIVDDLERSLTDLAERGLAPTRVDATPGVGRKAELIDPEGTKITFAQPLVERE